MEELKQTALQKKRPTLLTVLAVLSFIGSGISFFSYLMMSIYYNAFLEVFQSDLAETYKQIGVEIDTDTIINFFNAAGRPFFIFSTLAYFGSLYGVYKMWNLQKVGIHFYTISQLVVLLLPLLFVSSDLSAAPGLLFTLLFVLLYYRSFKMIENET
jgi:hypothetical protein